MSNHFSYTYRDPKLFSKCKGCKYLSQYGCTVCALCKRHPLISTVPLHIQERTEDKFEPKETL